MVGKYHPLKETENTINSTLSIYSKFNLILSDFCLANESRAYHACTFKLNCKAIIFRNANITPKKIGQFVTIWKRSQLGITTPFHINDDFDLVVINVSDDRHLGQFIFPKRVLEQKKVIAGPNSPGKRGMRVYPPWDATLSKQAKSTQLWQMPYFIDLKNKDENSLKLMQRLTGH